MLTELSTFNYVLLSHALITFSVIFVSMPLLVVRSTASPLTLQTYWAPSSVPEGVNVYVMLELNVSPSAFSVVSSVDCKRSPAANTSRCEF